MGEARRRGTREQRIEQAIVREEVLQQQREEHERMLSLEREESIARRIGTATNRQTGKEVTSGMLKLSDMAGRLALEPAIAVARLAIEGERANTTISLGEIKKYQDIIASGEPVAKVVRELSVEESTAKLAGLVRPEDLKLANDFMEKLPKQDFYHTCGYYPNDEYRARSMISHKQNGVAHSDLAYHIYYNLFYRPGRAFFVEGTCLNDGGLTKSYIEQLKKHLSDPANRQKYTRDTAPYH